MNIRIFIFGLFWIFALSACQKREESKVSVEDLPVESSPKEESPNQDDFDQVLFGREIPKVELKPVLTIPRWVIEQEKKEKEEIEKGYYDSIVEADFETRNKAADMRSKKLRLMRTKYELLVTTIQKNEVKITPKQWQLKQEQVEAIVKELLSALTSEKKMKIPKKGEKWKPFEKQISAIKASHTERLILALK